MKTNSGLLAKYFSWSVPPTCLPQSLLLLGIRAYWGWQFFGTGKGKLADLQKPTEFFQSLGIPFPHLNAIMAGTTECVGGLLLLLGLASRLISIPLAFVMCVAYATAESDTLKVLFSEPDKFFASDEFLFLFAAVLVLFFGPGKIALDWFLQRQMTARANQIV